MLKIFILILIVALTFSEQNSEKKSTDENNNLLGRDNGHEPFSDKKDTYNGRRDLDADDNKGSYEVKEDDSAYQDEDEEEEDDDDDEEEEEEKEDEDEDEDESYDEKEDEKNKDNDVDPKHQNDHLIGGQHDIGLPKKIDENGLNDEKFHYQGGEAFKEMMDQFKGQVKDEFLTRCKRPICNENLSCPMGPKTDARGCEICQCLEDPCKDKPCARGYECDPVFCKEGTQCTNLGFQCMRKQCRGPVPMCSNSCKFGYSLNDEGCMTCECNKLPRKPEEEEEEEEDDDDDDRSGNNLPPFIFKPSLQLDDPYKDSCKTSCHPSEFCYNLMECKKRTKCWYHMIKPKSFLGKTNPKCDPVSMEFEETQCVERDQRTCWCVDSLGFPIEGTISIINNYENKLKCVKNKTESVVMEFIFSKDKTSKGKDLFIKSLREAVAEIGLIPVEAVLVSKVSESDETKETKAFVKIKGSNSFNLGYSLELLKVSDLVINSKSGQYKLKIIPQPISFEYIKPLPYLHPHDLHKPVAIKRSFALYSWLLPTVFLCFFLILSITLFIWRANRGPTPPRHRPLSNKLPDSLDPSSFMRKPLASDSFVLVDDDVLNKQKNLIA